MLHTFVISVAWEAHAGKSCALNVILTYQYIGFFSHLFLLPPRKYHFPCRSRTGRCAIVEPVVVPSGPFRPFVRVCVRVCVNLAAVCSRNSILYYFAIGIVNGHKIRTQPNNGARNHFKVHGRSSEDQRLGRTRAAIPEGLSLLFGWEGHLPHLRLQQQALYPEDDDPGHERRRVGPVLPARPAVPPERAHRL